MADALCGPSNALQNFQKHTQVDRTLQHDRLVSRHNPTQAFRSSGPNAGLLDPEFEAFQAGHLASPAVPPPQFDTRPFLAQSNATRFAPPPQQQSAGLPDWANDFQRLHIAPTHHSPAPAVQRAPAATQTSSWHQDFLQSQQQPLTSFHQAQPMFQPFQGMSWDYEQAGQFSPVAQGKQRAVEQEAAAAQWNAEAFAAAFDAATEDAQAEESGLTEEMLAREIAREIEMETEEIQFLIQQKEAEETEMRSARAETSHLSGLDLSHGFLDVDEEFASADQHLEHMQLQDEATSLDEHLGMHEPVHDLPREAEALTRESTATPPAIDEELARTAGHLLESVSHDTSQKFQESVFLQLMRRLRDKEITVEGENFVEVSEDPLQSMSIPPPDAGVN